MKNFPFVLCFIFSFSFHFGCSNEGFLCSQEKDCPQGHVCNQRGFCRFRCILDSDCAKNEVCSPTSGCIQKVRVLETRTDKEMKDSGVKEFALVSPEMLASSENDKDKKEYKSLVDSRNIDSSLRGVCEEGTTQLCFSGPQETLGKGVCRAGNQLCHGGKWTRCIGEIKPSKEVCDGKDNNCDGNIDEELTRTCGNHQGECKQGSQTCSGGGWGACIGELRPTKEVCDGLDNDCDGKVDNACKKECVFHVSQSVLQYGVVSSSAKRLSLVLTNQGQKSCSINKTEVVGLKPAKGHTAFTLLNMVPSVLKPGQGFKAHIEFSTSTTDAVFEGVFRVLFEGSKKLEVKLSGQRKKSCFFLSQRQVDFGTVKQACQSRSVELTIYNQGAAGCIRTINILSVKLTSSSSTDFIARVAPSFTLGTRQKKTIRLEFSPKTTGIKKGKLILTTDVPWENQITIPIIGEGSSTAKRQDAFVQQQPTADILFVIDNSCSMSNHQQQLSKSTKSFFSPLRSSSFRVAVTTTDISASRHPAGCFVGRTRILKETTPSLEKELQNNVLVGVRGSDLEKGLEAARIATSELLLSNQHCNQGFLRKNASFSMIFVSDENDSSSGSTSFYIDYFRSLKRKHSLSRISASAITFLSKPDLCNRRSQYTGRYFDVATKLGGITASICHKDWSVLLETIARRAVELKSEFFLRQTAVESSIVVRVDGVVVKRGAGGWKFHKTRNSIVFEKPNIPSVGATVIVDYESVCHR